MRPSRRPARRLLTAGAVIVAVALGAAGCGGSVEKENTYVDQVNLAQTQFASSFTRLSREITASSTPAHDRKTLRAIQGTIEKTVTDLRAIHPPDKVKSLHGELVDAIAGYGNAIGTVAGDRVDELPVQGLDLVGRVDRPQVRDGLLDRALDRAQGLAVVRGGARRRDLPREPGEARRELRLREVHLVDVGVLLLDAPAASRRRRGRRRR